MKIATPSDANTLAEISKRAFHSDITCGGQSEGGPPGYESAQWQAFIMKKSKYYTFSIGELIVGGAIVFNKGKGHYYLGRIFIDPEYHRKGIGTEAMQLLLRKYSDARRWTLETPPWNIRTKAFYQKLGFIIIRESSEDLLFEKIMT
jgi:RimJ/RimL family protein N-acetyltransferase